MGAVQVRALSSPDASLDWNSDGLIDAGPEITPQEPDETFINSNLSIEVCITQDCNYQNGGRDLHF